MDDEGVKLILFFVALKVEDSEEEEEEEEDSLSQREERIKKLEPSEDSVVLVPRLW